jgi:orotate phosphoribosyltransferase
MMSESALNTLADEINAVARLTGTFTLRSGQTATEYFDKYRFEAQPKLLARIAAAMASLIPADTEVLAGLEMGGIPIATALSLHTGIPTAFIRKQAKPYGTARLAEGCEVAHRRVTVIEDVVTTGGQVVISTHDLRGLGAIVDHVLCVIDRSPDHAAVLTADGLQLHALLTRAQLDAAEARRSGPPIRP